MPEVIATEATDTSSLEHAASVFERLDSGETEDTSAVESQEEVVGEEQPEQLETDDVADDGNTEPVEGDEDDDAAIVAEPRKLKVKLPDGEQELPEDEVVKGYLRTADYTRKTQALAEETKAFRAKEAEVSAQAAQYATQLSQLAEALKQQSPQEPDWNKLREENPAEFAETWAAWQHHTQQMTKIEAARKEAIDRVTQDQIKHLNAHLESERAKLVEALPAWKDEAVATREREALYKFAQEKGGYTEAELNQVVDHRVMLLLRKAYLYDKAQSARPAVTAKIDAVKAATPGPASTTRRPPTSERTKAKQRLAQTGSIRDAAALFEQMDES
jgi:hypothetical protein